MAKKSYKDLAIWQKAMALTVEVYKLTKPLLESELTFSNQIRESAIYVTARIAEGHESLEVSGDECFDCLSSSHSHLMEVETQLRLGLMMAWFTEKDIETALNFCDEIDEDLISMMKELEDDD